VRRGKTTVGGDSELEIDFEIFVGKKTKIKREPVRTRLEKSLGCRVRGHPPIQEVQGALELNMTRSWIELR